MKAANFLTTRSQPAKYPTASGKTLQRKPTTSTGKAAVFPYQHTTLPIQPKLSINTPGDRYEQEADAMAEKVVQGHASERTPVSATPDNSIQRKCAHCEEEEKQKEKKPAIQRKAAGNGGFDAPPALATGLNARKGSGFSLPGQVRTPMENAFSADFSGVRIHADALAADMSSSIQARAFTHGHDIYFNRGAFAPDTQEGKRLLAHELTHVVQQGAGQTTLQRDEEAEKVEKQKIEALIVKIQKYGIIAVENDTANFTSAELDLADKALSGLPAKDKAAIIGAKLVRVQSLGSTTAGQYTSDQGYNGTNKTDEQKIELSDKAFIGGINASETIRLITHEVGHAIAAMPHRIAESEVLKAGVKFNQLVDETNVASGEFNTANDEYNAALEVSNAAVDVYNASKGPDRAGAKADMDQKQAETARLSGIRGKKETEYNTKKSASDAQEKVLKTKETAAQSKIANIDDLKTDAATKKTGMETAFKAASSVLDSNDAASSDYRSAVKAAQDAIKKFYQENVDVEVGESVAESAKAVVDAALKDRNNKRASLNSANAANPALTALTALEAAQDNCFKAATIVAMNRSMSLSVKRFYDFVVTNSISPALTTYAAENWPHKPEEFYAEAYSYFVTKPTDLEKYSKPLYDWFKAGKYQ